MTLQKESGISGSDIVGSVHASCSLDKDVRNSKSAGKEKDDVITK